MKLIDFKVNLKHTKVLLIINIVLLIVVLTLFSTYKQGGSSIPFQWQWAAQSLGIISPIICSVTNAFVLTGLLAGLLTDRYRGFSSWKAKLLVSAVLLSVCFLISDLCLLFFIIVVAFNTLLINYIHFHSATDRYGNVLRAFLFMSPSFVSVVALLFSWKLLGKNLWPFVN